jgi:hypothetical protein
LATIEILNAPPELPSRPRDCALLVTVPTTWEEFSADYSSGTDFVAGYTRQSGGLTVKAGWEAYQPYASLARHVMTSVRKLGVALFERATLAELHRAVAAYPVTTLVAHWRSARFRPSDIADAARIRAYLTKAGARVESADGSDRPEALCAALNSLLDEGVAAAGDDAPMGHGGLTAQQFRWHEKRALIEAALPGSFRGGAAVEFAAAFHTIAEITAGIAPSYSGTLDLTVCQSVLLGEMVRRKCPNSLVLTSAETTSMDFRFAVYHQVIEILARSSRPFEDAVIDVRKALVRRYDKSPK